MEYPIVVIRKVGDTFVIHYHASGEGKNKVIKSVTLPTHYVNIIAERSGAIDADTLWYAVNLTIEYSYVSFTDKGVYDVRLSDFGERYVKELQKKNRP